MQNDKTFLKATEKLLISGALTEENMYRLYSIIEPIIKQDEWQRIKEYPHHNEYNRGDHMMNVCCNSFVKSLNKSNCDSVKTAQGAILHDFFPYDWKDFNCDPDKLRLGIMPNFFDQHAFKHPLFALQNAIKYYPEIIDEKVADIILRHMWPLTVTRPRYPESWIVTLADKKDSLEILKNPNELPKYLGIKVKK